MVSNMSKTLLRNIIRHTDTHNRLFEESEMWRSHRAQEEKSSKRKRSRDSSRDPRPHSSISSSVRQLPRAHMDREASPDLSTHSLSVKKQIQDAEEKNPNRWGHAGYKELYPEQFLTDSDTESSSDEGTSTKRRKKSKKDHKSRKHSKKAKHKSDKKRKHKHKSKRSNESPGYEWVPKTDR